MLIFTFFVLLFPKSFFLRPVPIKYEQFTKQIYLTHEWDFKQVRSFRVRGKLGVMANESFTAHFPVLKNRSLTIICCFVSYLMKGLSKSYKSYSEKRKIRYPSMLV